MKYKLFNYLYCMARAKRTEGKYCYQLVMDGGLKEKIRKVAKKNRHTINDEIVIIVEKHVKKELKSGV